MIDSHVHLDDDKFAGEVDAVLERALASGIEAMISAGVDRESSAIVAALAEREPAVYAAVGFHPHEASRLQPDDLRALRELAAAPRVIAIGEIGLDYYRDHSPHEDQLQAFRQQLDLAAELGLPVIIHNRAAEHEMYPAVAQWAAQARAGYQGRPLGMMHCFSEDWEAAQRYLELGFFISIAATVTYPNAQTTKDVASRVPLDYLLSETDSPYLPPQGQRGQRNEPANVAAVVAQIAALRGLEPAAVAAATSRNARTLFGLAA